MREEVLVFIVMVATLLVGAVVTRNRREWSPFFLIVASVLGSLVSGMGIRAREIVEGGFGFLDASLSVTAATVFVFLLYKGGAFHRIFQWIAGIGNRALKSLLVLLFIAFPSSLTGFPFASLLTTGTIASSYMEKGGVKKEKITEILVIGSFIGMVMPPSSLPAIIASNGSGSVLPTPYNGFYLPLLAISLPLLIVYWLFNIKPLSSFEDKGKVGVEMVIAILVALAALFDGVFGSLGYNGGNTLSFFLGSVAVIIVEKGYGSAVKCFSAVSDSLMEAVVPVAFLFALGSFIEVSSMTGVRGLFSLRILPYSVEGVMAFMMALSVVVGLFFSYPLPAFLISYAVFPIGWLANPVVVTGVSMALAVTTILSVRSPLLDAASELTALDGKMKRKVFIPILAISILSLALGFFFLHFGDGFLWILNV